MSKAELSSCRAQEKRPIPSCRVVALVPFPRIAAGIVSDPEATLHFPTGFACWHCGFALMGIFQCVFLCALSLLVAL